CFMAGMLSHLDALLGLPLDEALRSLALSPTVRDAVLSRSGPVGSTLAAVEAWERGDWPAVAAVGHRDLTRVRAAYLDAVAWSEETVGLTAD
ncbi:MAG: diguanylate phosphodiesterase, partial [Gammaproteobacteria bacterium]